VGSLPTKSGKRPFRWIPGEGPDEAALGRLMRAFPRPAAPMGEAWFMGQKREMFTNLMGDLTAVPVADLFKALNEIASGTAAFGPLPEWSQWLHYLLGPLVPRDHETHIRPLVEALVTAFLTQYPTGAESEPYPGFRSDALDTLGRCLMDRMRWFEGKIIVGRMLHRGPWPSGSWFWFNASGDFSASMFFCLKYLRAEQVEAWIKSVLAMTCPHWRAQVIAWFVGAHRVLTGEIRQPSQFETIGEPSVDWDWSHCLNGHYSGDHGVRPQVEHFLPEQNRAHALAAVAAFMDEEKLLDWMLSIAQYDYLEDEIADLPYRFRALYIA
jgi:hypothetical protein